MLPIPGWPLLENSSISQVVYSSQYQAILNNSTGEQPSAYQKTLSDAFILGLIADGIWAKTDILTVGITDACGKFTDINWANPSGNKCIRTGDVQVGVNNGIKFNNVSTYIDTQFTPSLATNFTQNSAGFAIYCEDIRLNSSGGDGVTDGTILTLFNPQQAANQVRASINQSTTGTFTDASFDLSPGIYFVNRISSSQSTCRKNNNSRVTISSTSAGRSSRSFKIGAFDNNGPFSQFNARKNMLFWAGAALTTTDEANFYSRWTTFLTGIRNQTGSILGARYSKSTWSDLSDFTNNTASATVVSNKIHFTGGGSTSNTQYLQLNMGTMNAHWKINAIGTISTKDATSVGFGIGFISVASQSVRNYGWCGYFDGSTGANTGTARLENAGNGLSFGLVNASSAVSFNAGDTIELQLETFGLNVCLTVKINGVYSPPAITTNPTVANSRINTFMPTIFYKGGTVDISSFTYTVYEKMNAKYCFVGDSKDYGIGATLLNNGLVPKFANDLIVIANCGGASDRTTEYLQHITEVIALQPQEVVFIGCSNNPRFSVPNATTQSDFVSMINSLIAGIPGVKIKIVDGLYETSGLDQTAFSNWLTTNYPSYKIALLGNVITLFDTIHPDDAGHAATATSLASALP